jgi:hypothetical protein
MNQSGGGGGIHEMWALLTGGIDLACHLHLVPRLRMSQSLPPIRHMTSWYAWGIFTLTLLTFK